MKNLTMGNLSPTTNVVAYDSRINDLVKEMLLKHTGGKEFFENLDLGIRNKEIVKSLYDLVEKHLGCFQAKFIVTGKFGRFFANWVECFGFDMDMIYQVNGGLREDEPIESLEIFKEDLEGLEFIIVDDSLYSGKTNDIIREHVKSLGGIYRGTFVIYDGRLERDPNIHSLYRYYDEK